MVKTTWPCKNCKDRYVGCHATCSLYLEEQKVRAAIAAEKTKAQEADLFILNDSPRIKKIFKDKIKH